MNLSSHEKMNVLLEQINFDKSKGERFFEKAQLEKLEVFKQEKRWCFHFKLVKILPFDIYQLLRLKLQEAFSKIAEIDFFIKYEHQTVNEELICDYWLDFIESIHDLSPAYVDLLKENKPDSKDNKLVIKARNDTEAIMIKKRLTPLYQDYCEKTGLPLWPIDCIVETHERSESTRLNSSHVASSYAAFCLKKTR